ncbi:MAG TPA: ATP-binding protein [Candidatus Saccharimonadales bacterium]|nr:ATP-binding protein [Candidatus Saccharimonadales bacterium]
MKSFSLQRGETIKLKKTLLHKILDHILAILFSIIGILTILLIDAPISKMPALIFIPLILGSTWNGGLGAGILTSITSAILMNFYPLQSNSINFYFDIEHAIMFVLFATEGSFLSYLIHLLQQRARIGEYKKREREQTNRIFELEEQTKKYQKEIRSRDEFLSVASHELKTPLTSMLLQTQTALHNIRNVSVAHFSFEKLLNMLESVENQTKRLSKMINDLLSVSIITIGNLNLEYEEIDLDKLVKGVLTDFQARLDKENIKVIIDIEEKVIGNWDKIRIEQAISNFISNAIKYGLNKPIEITVKKDNRFAEFIIKDNGIGISKSKQKEIFELFQRAVSVEDYKGLGVGLYITQKIVLAHGGTVSVSSNSGRGSKFNMRLPLKRPGK